MNADVPLPFFTFFFCGFRSRKSPRRSSTRRPKPKVRPSPPSCCADIRGGCCHGYLSLPSALLSRSSVSAGTTAAGLVGAVTTKPRRGRKKLLKTGASTPLLDSPLTVRRFTVRRSTDEEERLSPTSLVFCFPVRRWGIQTKTRKVIT